MDIYKIIILVGLIEFSVRFLDVSGIREKLIGFFGVNHPIRLIYKMLRCHFCLSFWLAVVLFPLLFVPVYVVFIPSAVGWFWLINRGW